MTTTREALKQNRMRMFAAYSDALTNCHKMTPDEIADMLLAVANAAEAKPEPVAGQSKLPWHITEASAKKGREIVDAYGATVAKLTALDMPNAWSIVAAVNAALPAPMDAQPVSGAVDDLRNKWKMVDADCRDDGDGLITYHVSAFDEGYQAALSKQSGK